MYNILRYIEQRRFLAELNVTLAVMGEYAPANVRGQRDYTTMSMKYYRGRIWRDVMFMIIMATTIIMVFV